MATGVMATQPPWWRGLTSFFPIWEWLPKYDRSWLRTDIIAGIVIVALLVPEGMAYAELAGMPPETIFHAVPVIGVLLVSFSQSLGVAQDCADKHAYEIKANQELNAFALVNLATGLFGGQIAGGSMAPSAVNDNAGGRSQLASLVAWVAVILTLIFLTPLLTNLPETILAALILNALWHTVAARKLHTARLVSRPGIRAGIADICRVIFSGVLQGMLIGWCFRC